MELLTANQAAIASSSSFFNHSVSPPLRHSLSPPSALSPKKKQRSTRIKKQGVGEPAGMARFINYTALDAKKLSNGVARSGKHNQYRNRHMLAAKQTSEVEECRS